MKDTFCFLSTGDVVIVLHYFFLEFKVEATETENAPFVLCILEILMGNSKNLLHEGPKPVLTACIQIPPNPPKS